MARKTKRRASKVNPVTGKGPGGRYFDAKGRFASAEVARITRRIARQNRSEGKKPRPKPSKRAESPQSSSFFKEVPKGLTWEAKRLLHQERVEEAVDERRDYAREAYEQGHTEQAAMFARMERDRTLLERGKVPPTMLRYRGIALTRVWIWEGLDGVELAVELLRLLNVERPKPRTRVVIYTGQRDEGSSTGTRYDTPASNVIFLRGWMNRPSGRAILDEFEAGKRLFVQVDAVTPAARRRKANGKKRVQRGKGSSRGGKRTGGNGRAQRLSAAPTRNVRAVQRKGMRKVRGEQGSRNQRPGRGAARRGAGGGKGTAQPSVRKVRKRR